jgi:N-acetylmuramoyl-L-alanine amidase
MMETALMCMALNIFFEARSEPIQGQIAVAEVTLNRVASDDYPNTICEVVLQENKNGCSFSWWCDGKSDYPKEHNSFQTSKSLAKLMIDNGQYISVVGKDATHYHTDDIKPYWSDDMVKVEQVGKHIFYAKNNNNIKPLPRPEIISKLYP